MAEWYNGKWVCGRMKSGKFCKNRPVNGRPRCALHGAYSGRPKQNGDPPISRPADYISTRQAHPEWFDENRRYIRYKNRQENENKD